MGKNVGLAVERGVIECDRVGVMESIGNVEMEIVSERYCILIIMRIFAHKI